MCVTKLAVRISHLNLDFVRNESIMTQDMLTNYSYKELWIIGSVISLLAACIVTVFYIPFNWTRNLTDIGYNHATEGKKNKTKVDAINKMRRLRKIGHKLPPPYPNGWFALLESKDLRVSEAKSVDCLGQNFVVFRTEKGDVHVLDAYCPHLGANLGVGGIVRDDCIECPFHQWAFRGSDGQCTNIPYSKTGIVPKIAKLKKWTSCESNGSIFVWHHVEPEEQWELPVISEIENKKWVYHGRNEFLINCHIQDIPENGADTAHLASVHGPNMLSGSDLRFSRASWAAFGMHSWQASWGPCEEQNHIARMSLKHSIRLFNKIELCSMKVSAIQIGPGYVQLMMDTSTGPMVVLQTVTPIEPLIQKVVHRFYAPRSNALLCKFTIWGESVMFERDIMVWNHKQFMDTPLLIKEDRLIKSYRNWYSQFYSENSISFTMAKENLDW